MDKKNKTYGQIYDTKCIIISSIKILLLLSTVFIVSFIFFSKNYVGISVLISSGYIFYHYLGSVRKIVFEEERIVLFRFPNPIYLSYDIISSPKVVEYRDIKLLQKKSPSFTIFGKSGWYRSKKLDDIFVYSYSDKYKDNILLEYGADFYMFSVQNREAVLDLLLRKTEYKTKGLS